LRETFDGVKELDNAQLKRRLLIVAVVLEALAERLVSIGQLTGHQGLLDGWHLLGRGNRGQHKGKRDETRQNCARA
jgi:hypothetical protein